jgi:hypothetical protein
VASVALAVAGLVLFGALCLAIRREDRSPHLTCQAPTAGTALTRRVAGLSVRRAPPSAPEPEPRADLWAAPCPPGSDQEGR